MIKKLSLMAAVAMAAAMLNAAPQVRVDRIEPTDWFVGLDRAVPSVQLMVYGENIRDAEV